MTNDNNPATGAQGQQPVSLDKEIQVANLQLQLATARSNAEYNASAAGQIQRQFENMQRCAKPYAESTIVPTAYRGNIGNCIIALDLAYRMNLPALMVMKELYVVNGSPSWSSKFLVACINKLGRFTNIRYRKRPLGKIGRIKVQQVTWKDNPNGSGRIKDVKLVDTDEFKDIDNFECVAYCTEKSTGEVLESDPVTIEMAIKEGWYTKDGSKWVTMPQLMLTYRAAAFWQRVYAPEVSMGFPTREEIEDIQDIEYEDMSETPVEESAPKPQPTASVEEAKEKLRERRDASPKPSIPAPSLAEAKEKVRSRAASDKGGTQPSVFDMP
ncbi:MAG: hypothetical protein K1V84_01120 [Muribaculaceae bacterium]